MLTASYPTSVQGWAAQSKDQGQADPGTITVYAVAIYDPDDQYDVQIFKVTSAIANHPTANSALPPHYTLTGGGAQAHYSSQGQFLTASCPAPDLSSWMANSQDHLAADPGSVTAYAIGIRPLRGAPAVTTSLFQDTAANEASHTSEDVTISVSGRVPQLTGGGASVTERGVGNLLTASYPSPDAFNEWQANSQDQQQADPEFITAYAIGAVFGVVA
jgi:hypothetical protein